MSFADVNGQRLYFEDTGGDKPAIIFSHGLLMDHTMFDPQIAALREKWRCITWDERGHGQTGEGAPLPNFTYWDSADDLAALLAQLGIERAVLAGMSQGGFLSLRAALRYPKLVRALVLIDTQAGTETAQGKIDQDQMTLTWRTYGLIAELGQGIAHIILGDGWAETPAWIEKWGRVDPVRFQACMHALHEREDLTPRLSEIRVPALIVHGDLDAAIPMEAAQALAKGLGGQLVAIPGGGHAANLTHPDPVNAAIGTFLGSLPALQPA